jgi:hypothetical protein
MKISPVLRKEGPFYSHWCPGCEEMHRIHVDAPNSSGACWVFDGNIKLPTFTPSINIRIGPMPTVPFGRPDAGKMHICHYFLKVGQIQFLSDSTHLLAGKTILLPLIPERE